MSTNPQREMFRKIARRRDDGIQRALDHAEQENRNWRESALLLLETFLLERGGIPFLAEAFRVYAKRSKRVPDPPDARAWGAVMTAAKKSGMIVACGAERALTSNLSFKVLWRKKEG
jgi:hypothetical protein